MSDTAAAGITRLEANAVRHHLLPGWKLRNTRQLTQPQRDAVRTTARALRLVADRMDEALAAGRQDLTIDAVQLAGDAGVRVQQLRELLK